MTSMSDEPVPDYLAPYTRAVAAHGTGFGALLMTAQEWQELRFGVFTGALGLHRRAIADLGSGRGDLLDWLERAGVAYQRYVGVEAVPELHEFARQRFGGRGPEVEFVEADFVQDLGLFERLVGEREIDVILFSGSLNTLVEADALAVLDRAWAALPAGGVLGFNFLAGGGDWPRPATRLPRRELTRWFAWACERTPLVIVCQHYLGAHDATIVMIRPE